LKISEIIGKLEAHHDDFNPKGPTCDGYKCGDPEKECKGIVTTCCPTADVIKQAHEIGANLIIAHEPCFYSHFDKADVISQNEVYKAKIRLIEETGMVIYRDHDHIHNDSPDGIFTGIIRYLGWEKYRDNSNLFMDSAYVMPERTARDVADELIEKVNMHGIRIIGDPDLKVRKIGFSAHFLGGENDLNMINIIDREKYDLVIPGEVIDWSIGEFTVDSASVGHPFVLMNLGHFNMESLGMKYMAEWLPDVIDNAVRVTYIQSGDNFRWIGR
jgi:hypothetical protein